MKKTVSLIFVLLFSAVYAVADDISREQALQIASQFVSHPSTQQLSRRRAPAQPATPTLAHSMKSQVQAGKDNVYIVNLGNGQGFVVVSGESGTGDEVLGYCDHGTFSYDDCPVQLQDLLQGYATGIDSLRRNPAMVAPRRAVKTWPDYIGSIVVGPLLTTTWNQWAPYNDLCPQAESWGGQYGGRAPTGCYPTALAQVMNYWKWPETTIGTVRNEDFSGRHYDWDNMLDDYSQGYNSQQARAVAQLMADIGKAFGTVYGQDNGSPTTFGYLQLANNFGYQPDINIERGITAADLMDKMKKELDEKRPIIYCAFPDIEKEQDAHALVCDGYTDQDYFHFNYGWGGKADGFYKNAMATGYCYAAEMFTGVRPYVAVRKVIDGIEYALLKNGTAEVTDYTLGKGGRENGDVTIPAVVSDDEGKQYRVTSIRTHAFYSKGHFGKLTLGENVESIDRFAFIGVSIKELVLSDKMVNVPDESFYTIPINKLTIGASVKSIGYRAFGLSGLSEITCKSEAFEVGDQAFFMCTNLDCGEWLSHITKIGKSAFTGANFHTAPDFKRLVEVGSKAFQSCRFAGNTFTVPKTLKRIAPDAFDGSTLSWFVVKDNPNFYCAKDQMGYLCNSSGTSLIMTVSNPVMPIGNPNMDAFPDNMVRMEPGSIRARGNICIPSTIVEMEGAFKDCNPFVTLTILTKVPPVITEATFSEKFFDDDPWLFVPEGSVELYANAPVWNRFYIATDDREYGPLPEQERQYQMVVNATTDDNRQRVSIPVSDVSSMQIADDGLHAVIKQQGKADLVVSLAAIDSITWAPGFILDNAEVFDLNDSTLTVEAQKCTVTFDATCIDSDVQLCVRNAVLTPQVVEGVTRGFAVDLSLSNGVHELSGTADITIPVAPNEGEKIGAAYYNEETGQWEPVSFKYDEGAGTVIITTNHLSLYSLFYTKGDLTPLTMLTYYGVTPTLYDVDEAIKKLLHIVSSDDPDAQMIREYKDEMGFWQSVGLDGIYNAVTSISEPLLDFKPEALDHAVTAMGYLGTALSILDVVGADIKGDDVGVLKGTLSTVLNYTSGQMAAAIGTPIMAASSACVAFIGIALDKLYTSVMDHKRDMFREAYRYYYSMKGFNDLIGSSSYKVDEKNPHGFYRTTKDWYDHFYPIIAEGRLTKDRLEGVIEQTVRMYCNRFWDDNEEVRTWSYDYAKTQGLSSYMWISQSDMDQISDEYYAELMNGPMVSVVAAIKRNIAAEADVRYKKALERVAAIVNTQYRLRISDSSAPKDGKSKYAGWKMRFNDVPSTVADPKQWECVIADDGTATLGPVTVFSMLQNEMPFSVTLCDLNGTEKKTWNFQISENTGKRGIKVDLATSGIEVEAPKLSNLILTYDPDIVEIPYTWDGYLYSYDDENNIRKEPASASGAIDIRLDGSLNKRARFQYEVEKFFKQHDFISVDPSGHIKIGDDIVGTMKGNEGSGKFTINTTHPFVEKTKQQFVYDFNHIWSKEGDIFGLWNLLSGTISHKIDCEFTVVRSEADDSYVVTYTGAGTYKFTAEGVALIENFNQTAFQNGEVMHNTVDDISTGITEAEGKVTLSYTTKLQ